VTYATAVDGSGNVFVTGYLIGSMAFGSTVLTSRGTTDLYVAKFVPSTGTWAWAVQGGGSDDDRGYGVAVVGNSVYVAGYFTNNTTNGKSVLFGGTGPTAGTAQVNGASGTTSNDIVLVKYVDNGNSATLSWTQVAGGSGDDFCLGMTASGNSVYLTGAIDNNRANSANVLFGGSGTAPGTVPQYGTSSAVTNDLVLAKYIDNGSSAALGWTQVAGGSGYDYGYGVVVSGSQVYVTGNLSNNMTDDQEVVFGGSGKAAGYVSQSGASPTTSLDLIVAKYLDNGNSASIRWTQVAGGSRDDYGRGIAVNGSNVYVSGYCYNNTVNSTGVVFGGSGLVAGTLPQYGATATASNDLVVAKYFDNGSSASVGWTQVAGGTAADQGYGITASGNNVFVTGELVNTAANANGVVFGGSGSTPGTMPQAGASSTATNDLVVAKYTDNGSSATLAWTQLGGGSSDDGGRGIVVAGQSLYVAGYAVTPATFGSMVLTTVSPAQVNALARLTDPTLMPLASRAPDPGTAGLTFYPNPAHGGAATLTGTPPGAAVTVYDALGRPVAAATADAAGTAALGGLAPGVYVVRVGQQAVRLTVE